MVLQKQHNSKTQHTDRQETDDTQLVLLQVLLLDSSNLFGTNTNPQTWHHTHHSSLKLLVEKHQPTDSKTEWCCLASCTKQMGLDCLLDSPLGGQCGRACMKWNLPVFHALLVCFTQQHAFLVLFSLFAAHFTSLLFSSLFLSYFSLMGHRSFNLMTESGNVLERLLSVTQEAWRPPPSDTVSCGCFLQCSNQVQVAGGFLLVGMRCAHVHTGSFHCVIF